MAEATENNQSNQRVTNAVLALKIDQLSNQLKEWRDESCAVHEKQEKRIREIERWKDRSADAVEDIKRQNRVESTVMAIAAGIAAILFGQANR